MAPASGCRPRNRRSCSWHPSTRRDCQSWVKHRSPVNRHGPTRPLARGAWLPGRTHASGGRRERRCRVRAGPAAGKPLGQVKRLLGDGRIDGRIAWRSPRSGIKQQLCPAGERLPPGHVSPIASVQGRALCAARRPAKPRRRSKSVQRLHPLSRVPVHRGRRIRGCGRRARRETAPGQRGVCLRRRRLHAVSDGEAGAEAAGGVGRTFRRRARPHAAVGERRSAGAIGGGRVRSCSAGSADG
mmetsp:Transcript_19191/g.73428  ORF Transcript_19191/g.73428 Transcript_19191/m.73428 type:complete len:242 (-) Transcript_19191:658-1383(-)